MSQHANVILHAPNVHTGGGKVLLDSVLIELQSVGRLKACLLDSRYVKPKEFDLRFIHLFSPTLTDRIAAEMRLVKLSSTNDVILCFGNLPPLFRPKGTVKLFLQNRVLFPNFSLENYAFYVQIRILLERFWLYSRLFKVDEVLVQSNSMRDSFLSSVPAFQPQTIVVRPFLPDSQLVASEHTNGPSDTFIYVSSGEVHKNHSRLLKAWGLLAKQGVFPELRLTLHPRFDKNLIDEMNAIRKSSGAKMINLGRLTHGETMSAYRSCSVLVYPSYLESFGLPLYEAKNLGLTILASERDFVRDVLDPAETFDPMSERSISDAVLRYLKKGEVKLEPISTKEFCQFI